MGNNTSEEPRPAGPRCTPIRPSMTASSLAYFYAAGILWFGAVALAVPPDYALSAQGLKLAHVSQDNPIKLCAAAVFAYLANLPAYVYHSNAGV